METPIVRSVDPDQPEFLRDGEWSITLQNRHNGRIYELGKIALDVIVSEPLYASVLDRVFRNMVNEIIIKRDTDGT